jgi:alkanesulfonate monooxygenase SsuD/methylene tetrahydromethanopterin reductase-like flavin-dependent oxidoreductase (luciferase family)
MASSALDLGLMFSFRNPAKWRRPFTEVYRDELKLIQQAEEMGYDTIWLTEHHFADDGYSPSIVTIAAAVAAVTERVRIGFNLLLLPLHNAIRVAEDIATLDVISGGRIDVGLGQGYATHEFAGYGIPRSERLGRFVEGIEVLKGLWTQDTFSYSGRHYEIDSARLVPKPVQQPMPPLWIGATTGKAVARAGRLGAHLLGLNFPHLQRVYESALTEAGHDLDAAKVLQLHWTHVADSADQAWAEAGPHFHHLLSVYAQWNNESAATGGGGVETVVPPLEDLRGAYNLMFDPKFGSPDEVRDALRAANERLRTTHLGLGVLPGVDPQLTRRSMEQFMSDVAPGL